MRLSELRPCECCGGPLFLPPSPRFWIIRATQAALTEAAVQAFRASNGPGVSTLAEIEAELVRSTGGLAGAIDEGVGPSAELLFCPSCYDAVAAEARRLVGRPS